MSIPIGSNNTNLNSLNTTIGNGPQNIHKKSAEKAGTTDNGNSVQTSSSHFSGIKKFLRNVGHVPQHIMRTVRKNQGKAIHGDGVSTEKGLKRAYAQLFQKDITLEKAQTLVAHLLSNDENNFLKDKTPSLGKQLVKILNEVKPNISKTDIMVCRGQTGKITSMDGKALDTGNINKQVENYNNFYNNCKTLLTNKGNYNNYKQDFNNLKLK